MSDLVARLDDLIEEVADVASDARDLLPPDWTAIRQMDDAHNLLVRASNRLHQAAPSPSG